MSESMCTHLQLICSSGECGFKEKVLNNIWFGRDLKGDGQKSRSILADINEKTLVVTVQDSSYMNPDALPHKYERFSGICEAK